MTESFFDKAEDHSRLKAEIVSKYFGAWANVVKPHAKRRGESMYYIDLFSGPGRYKNGEVSTPLKVLQHCIDDKDLREILVAIFNDGEVKHTELLKQEIESLPGINSLRHRPVVHCSQVDERMAQHLRRKRLPPTFSFVDPFGFKGLTRDLIHALIKDWGCDCVFFFNFNRINMVLGNENDSIENHVDRLFGSDVATQIRTNAQGLTPEERESHIMEAVSVALKTDGANFVLPFRFQRADEERTSHYLVFVTKNFRGYDIMKSIMASASSKHEQGVPRFEYIPATPNQQLLMEFARPLEELESMLLDEFAGQRIKFQSLYEKHSVGHRFISKNYKDVLLRMERDGQISANPPSSKRRKDTLGDNVEILFPPRE